eukprot:1303641-Amphidinium_carterae.1
MNKSNNFCARNISNSSPLHVGGQVLRAKNCCLRLLLLRADGCKRRGGEAEGEKGCAAECRRRPRKPAAPSETPSP